MISFRLIDYYDVMITFCFSYMNVSGLNNFLPIFLFARQEAEETPPEDEDEVFFGPVGFTER